MLWLGVNMLAPARFASTLALGSGERRPSPHIALRLKILCSLAHLVHALSKLMGNFIMKDVFPRSDARIIPTLASVARLAISAIQATRQAGMV